MPDPFEGHLPSRSVRGYAEMTSGVVGLGVVGMATVGSDETEGLEEQRGLAERRARELFLNCWHANDVESEAMWVLYGGRGATIAIRSTISRIESAMRKHDDLRLGAVKYIRFDHDAVDTNDYYAPVFHKRISFEHEKEVRLVVHRTGDPNAESALINVNLRTLVESVRLAPGTPENMVESVRIILDKFDLTGIPVGGSILDKHPSYR